MRRNIRAVSIPKAFLVGAVVVFCLPLLVPADDALPQSRPGRIVYKAPSGGHKVRVDAGPRGGNLPGTGDPLPNVCVLSPEDLGLTTQETPALFWYLSKATGARVKITLTSEEDADPVLELQPAGEQTAGIHRIDLAAQKVRLVPGVQYQWVIALSPDPAQHSLDKVASGLIKRVRPSETLAGKLSRAGRADQPVVYAEEGIFYDALAALSDLIAANPANGGLHTERADLLAQVNLADPAADDRRAARAMRTLER